MANRSIEYKWASSYYRVGRDDAVRVRFDVLNACNMPAEVFAYRMLPVDPSNGQSAATYDHTCSPVDLVEYPANEPVPGESPEWFRLSYVDVLVRSTAEAVAFVNRVRRDLSSLKASLDRTDTLMPGIVEMIGDAVCDSSSSSSSSSESSSDSSSESLGELLSLAAIGTYATSVGPGIAWTATGSGAGSPVDDANVSTVTLRKGQASQTLVVQGFDFSDLPADATIYGIEVSVWLRETLGGSLSSNSDSAGGCDLPQELPAEPGPPVLRFLALHQPALGPTENKATGEVIDNTDFAAAVGGGDDDLWDVTGWTAALVKSGEFGVMLNIGVALGNPLAAAAVNGAEITIYYRA